MILTNAFCVRFSICRQKHTNKMDSPFTSTTTIIDLNDDCLREVFESFAVVDLCALVDVCIRFKQLAQDCFRANFTRSDNWKLNDVSQSQKFKLTSKIMRNFGGSITQIRTGLVSQVQSARRTFSHDKSYQARLVDLIALQCSEKLTEMDLDGDIITDELAFGIRPALQNLRAFHLMYCEFSQLFLGVLPHWSPNIRKLSIHYQYGTKKKKLFNSNRFVWFASKFSSIGASCFRKCLHLWRRKIPPNESAAETIHSHFWWSILGRIWRKRYHFRTYRYFYPKNRRTKNPTIVWSGSRKPALFESAECVEISFLNPEMFLSVQKPKMFLSVFEIDKFEALTPLLGIGFDRLQYCWYMQTMHRIVCSWNDWNQTTQIVGEQFFGNNTSCGKIAEDKLCS